MLTPAGLLSQLFVVEMLAIVRLEHVSRSLQTEAESAAGLALIADGAFGALGVGGAAEQFRQNRFEVLHLRLAGGARLGSRLAGLGGSRLACLAGLTGLLSLSARSRRRAALENL